MTTIRLLKLAAGLVAVGTLTLAGAGPALAEGPGTGVCGPSHGSFNAQGGPGYAQYGPPPLSPVAGDILCGGGF